MITIFSTYDEASETLEDLQRCNGRSETEILLRGLKENPDEEYGKRPLRLAEKVTADFSGNWGQGLEYTCFVGLFINEIKNRYVADIGFCPENDLIEYRRKLEGLVAPVQRSLQKAESLTYGAKVVPFFYTVEEDLGADFREGLGNQDDRKELAKEMKELGMPYSIRILLLALFRSPLSRLVFRGVYSDGFHRGLDSTERERFESAYRM